MILKKQWDDGKEQKSNPPLMDSYVYTEQIATK